MIGLKNYTNIPTNKKIYRSIRYSTSTSHVPTINFSAKKSDNFCRKQNSQSKTSLMRGPSISFKQPLHSEINILKDKKNINIIASSFKKNIQTRPLVVLAKDVKLPIKERYSEQLCLSSDFQSTSFQIQSINIKNTVQQIQTLLIQNRKEYSSLKISLQSIKLTAQSQLGQVQLSIQTKIKQLKQSIKKSKLQQNKFLFNTPNYINEITEGFQQIKLEISQMNDKVNDLSQQYNG